MKIFVNYDSLLNYRRLIEQKNEEMRKVNHAHERIVNGWSRGTLQRETFFFNTFHLSDHLLNLRVRLSIIYEINLRLLIKRTVYNIPLLEKYIKSFLLYR